MMMYDVYHMTVAMFFICLSVFCLSICLSVFICLSVYLSMAEGRCGCGAVVFLHLRDLTRLITMM